MAMNKEMNISFKDVKDEASFFKIAALYKKSFDVRERIKTKSFHRYAYQEGISFKSVYLNNEFIGFYKGFLEKKNLYISWFALKDPSHWEIVVSAIENEFMGLNVIFVLRKEEEIAKYEKLGFARPKLGRILKASNPLFVCNKPELFVDEEIVEGIKKHDWPLMFGASSKTYVYYSSVKDIKIDDALPLLPKFRQDIASSFKFDKDKKLSIGAYLLLQKALKLHHIDIEKEEFYYEENGKPHLKGNPIELSLSHSGEYVAVALNKKPVGIDIQKMEEIRPNLTKVVFNENDSLYYDESLDKRKAFYKIWTFKEAYIKMTGEGLQKPLKDIFINYLFAYNGTFFYNFDLLSDYQISIAAETFGIKRIKELKM